jgi:hypothetical protein
MENLNQFDLLEGIKKCSIIYGKRREMGYNRWQFILGRIHRYTEGMLQLTSEKYRVPPQAYISSNTS